MSGRAGVPHEPSNALFAIVESVAYNYGYYSRVRARLRAGKLPVKLEAVFLSRRSITVPVSDYEPISTDEACFCLDHEVADEEDSYAGEAALDVTGHNLAW